MIPSTPHKQLLEHIDDLVAYIGEDLRYHAMSNSYQLAFGKKDEKLVGQDVLQSTGDPFSPKGDLHYIKKALLNTPTLFSRWVEFPNGKHRYMEVRYKPAKNENNEIEGVVILAKDYSRLKRDQDRIMESEQQFRRAVQLAPYPVMIHKENGDILIVNDTWLDITQYDRNKIRKMDDWLESAFGFWKDKIASQYKNFWSNDTKISDGEFIVRTNNNSYRIWSFRAAHLGTDENGDRLAITAATDLTETKEYEDKLKDLNESLEERVLQNERDLKQSEEEFRRAFNTASHGMAIMDLDGSWIRVNDAFSVLIDYSREELTELRMKNLVDNETYLKERKKLNLLIKGDLDSYNMEKQLIRKDKSKIWVLTSVSIIRDESGHPLHFIAQIIDINDRKIFEKNLIIAMQQAEEANRHKSEFLANVGHEIRTPLNSIIGFSQLLQDSLKGTDKEDYANTIVGSGTTLLNLINDILDLSAIEAGQLEIKPTRIKLDEVLQEAIKVFEYDVEKKGIELDLEIGSDCPSEISIDDKRLRQILLNLIGNAVKFTEEGSVIVKIRADNFTANNCTLFLEVTDTGIGIAQSSIEEIFEAFTQQSGQDSRKYGGTGLGLAITRKLVDAMNGRICVDSKEGQGTTFTVSFHDVEFHLEIERSDNQEIAPRSLKSLNSTNDIKAIVIEEDPASNKLIHNILNKHSIMVIPMESSISMPSLKKQKPSIMICDIHAKVIQETGLPQLLEYTSVESIPVITIGSAHEEYLQDFINSSKIASFFLKPISTNALEDKIIEVLNSKQHHDNPKNVDVNKALSLINKKFMNDVQKAMKSGIIGEYEKILPILEEIDSLTDDLTITQFVNIARYRFDQFEFEELNVHLSKIETLVNILENHD